ncbi:MAG: DUF5615 family PIN-like protein [Epsilonproteobacteria bacterium]|nr:DUF5615 family PIN-like protein [Campylobacterota bacterium]
MCVKLLLDQNLSYRLIAKLEDLYPNSLHIAALNMDSASDKEVWSYAKENGFTIVTKDSDFNEMATLYGFPPHIIWLRLGNSKIEAVQNALTKHHDTIHQIIHENETGIIEIKG